MKTESTARCISETKSGRVHRPHARRSELRAPQAGQFTAIAEHRANESGRFFPCGERNALWLLGARLVASLLLFISLSTSAAVREVGAIGLTVANLDREREFFTKVLPFKEVAVTQGAGRAQDELLGLSGTRTRSAEFQLGAERIILTEHLSRKGRPTPADSRSFDHWFQHIAIVVSDMDKAYAHLRAHNVKHVSTAPQTLPAWNKDAGGIKAFYFRDPEDHVLEIIWFPPGKGDPKWQQLAEAAVLEAGAPAATGRRDAGGPRLFLGIDHTAIVVSDTDRSLAFYRDTLGLKVAGGAENYGVEQEHLNQVFGARLRITALRAERGPGIEFLEYITPPGGRPLPADARANDLVFWNTHLTTDDLGSFASEPRALGARFVSKRVVSLADGRSAAARSVIVRDPDGHALQLTQPASALTRN